MTKIKNSFKNIPMAIGRLEDVDAFAIPLPEKNDQGGAYAQFMETHSLRKFFFSSFTSLFPNFIYPPNYTKIFDANDELRSPHLKVRLKEFATMVLRAEQAAGYDPQKTHYQVHSTDEIIKKPDEDFLFRSFFNGFHRDAPHTPDARIYVLSDSVAPTRIKDGENIITPKAHEVWRMYGKTLHARGPIVDREAARRQPTRRFARIIATNG